MSKKLLNLDTLGLVSFVCILTLLSPIECALPHKDYVTEHELELALLHSVNNESIPNLYVLANTFFPPQQRVEPVCVPVQYSIHCENSPLCTSTVCINCTNGTGFVSDYLWTVYDVKSPIGNVLLSYALDGIDLVGFSSWEESCSLSDPIILYLNLNLTDSSQDVVLSSLAKISSQLKKYAATQGTLKIGDTANNGFAIQWNSEDREKVFDAPNTILTVEFVFLNIFVCLLSVSMTTYTYDNLFRNVKHKKNPGYPIFWGVVVFTLCWNVGPSWLVLLRNSSRVTYSLMALIPIQFFVALFLKKKSNFPIPGMSPNGCLIHRSGYHFIWERSVITCCRCLVTHLVQVLAIWSILVTLTLIVYYLTAITVTFYLYPAATLVKVVFAKGIAVCTILIFSLVFSLSKFKWKCTSDAVKHNCTTVLSLITVISFLPILIYIAFVIGGIIFAETSDNNTVKSILTLLPSVFLLFVAWASRGHLFPEGIHTTDAADELISDLEKGATQNHHKKKQAKDKASVCMEVPTTPSAETYNHCDTLETNDNGQGELKQHVNNGSEYTPLL